MLASRLSQLPIHVHFTAISMIPIGYSNYQSSTVLVFVKHVVPLYYLIPATCIIQIANLRFSEVFEIQCRKYYQILQVERTLRSILSTWFK